jgi:hypothetical protein
MPCHDSHSYSYSVGSSITHGESVSESIRSGECISHSSGYAGTPIRSYAGDPTTIARCIFHDEVRDALIVLKNCGALRVAEEREWCVMAVQRLLLELFSDDMA